MAKKPPASPLYPDSTVEDVAAWPYLGDLNAISVAVYIRVVAASRDQGRAVKLLNRDLLPGKVRASLSIRRALKELAAVGLVKVRHALARDSARAERTIELLP